MSAFMDNLGIIGPAMIAGLLVLLSHVPLGQQVLARGIVFIDLAIAQVAGLGKPGSATRKGGSDDPTNINSTLSQLWLCQRRSNAYGCLPILLHLSRLRRDT